MLFSLINVTKQDKYTVDGYWIQNHIGILREATEQAKKIEDTNGNKITVAVVPDVNSPVAIEKYWQNLKRLDKR